jgi:hypothetical protein
VAPKAQNVRISEVPALIAVNDHANLPGLVTERSLRKL